MQHPDRSPPPHRQRNGSRRNLQRVLPALVVVAATGCGVGLDPLGLRNDGGAELGSDAGACPGIRTVGLSTHRSDHGAWTLVLPSVATHAELTIQGRRQGEAAAAVDWVGAGSDASGLVVSMPTTATDVSRAAAGLATLVAAETRKEFASVSVRYAGRRSITHDGHPAVFDTILELTRSLQPDRADAVPLSWTRNLLFPILLGGDLTRFYPLPRPSQDWSTQFVLALSTVLRPAEKRLLVSGAVVTRAGFDSSFSAAAIRAGDMARGTLLGGAQSVPRATCSTVDVGGTDKLDLIWVVDELELGNMGGVRAALHQAVPAMWSEARDLGLDFRMAVVGMGRRTGETRATLCNPLTYEKGSGKFWSPDSDGDIAIEVQSCLLGPQGNRATGKGAYGLQVTREVLTGLLPRAAADPTRLRTGARVAVVLVSDTPASSVADLFGGTVPPDPLDDQQKAKLDAHVRPFVDLLAGKAHAQNAPFFPAGTAATVLAGTMAYALTADPEQSCGKDHRGTGYRELVQASGGLLDHVCHTGEAMERALGQVLRDMARRVRPAPLLGNPAAASLAVEHTGTSTEIARSLRRGFDLDVGSSSLLFYGLKGTVVPGSTRLRVSYVRW